MRETKLVSIPPQQAAEVWPLVREWVDQAAARSNGRFTETAILGEIEQGRQQLWVIWDPDASEARAVGVSQVLVYPTGLKVADIIILTGVGRKDWKHLMTGFEDWARRESCGVVQVFARKGWAREFPDFKMSHVLLEKKL